MTSRKSEIIYTTPLGIVSGYIKNENYIEVSSELEVCKPVLPEHMTIPECRIFKWNITAIGNCSNLIAVCEFKPNNKIDGGPNSGQWIEAQTWEDKNYVLSIGTDDGEFLNFRANQNIIPKRFFTDHINGLDWVTCNNNGLEIKIPDLLKGETIELRFSVAWKDNELNKDNNISTWYAVEVVLHPIQN